MPQVLSLFPVGRSSLGLSHSSHLVQLGRSGANSLGFPVRSCCPALSSLYQMLDKVLLENVGVRLAVEFL